MARGRSVVFSARVSPPPAAKSLRSRAARRHRRCASTAGGWNPAVRRSPLPREVAESPAELGVQDLVVIAVKGPALASVAASIAPLLGADTTVVTAMNGVPWWFFQGFGGPCEGMQLKSIDPGGQVAAAIPAGQVVGCVVHASCTTPEPGLTRNAAGKRLIFGEPRRRYLDAIDRIRRTVPQRRLRHRVVGLHPA